jgi:hypothetical protein
MKIKFTLFLCVLKFFYITCFSKLFEPSGSFTMKSDQILVVLLSVPENHEHGVYAVVLCTSYR